MNILPLFCEVDDFFLAFEKYQAQRQLPGRCREKRGRPPKTASQRGHDDLGLLSSKSVSDVQGLLSQRSLPPLAWGVSKPGELQPVCRPQVRSVICVVCLSLHTLGCL